MSRAILQVLKREACLVHVMPQHYGTLGTFVQCVPEAVALVLIQSVAELRLVTSHPNDLCTHSASYLYMHDLYEVIVFVARVPAHICGMRSPACIHPYTPTGIEYLTAPNMEYVQINMCYI